MSGPETSEKKWDIPWCVSCARFPRCPLLGIGRRPELLENRSGYKRDPDNQVEADIGYDVLRHLLPAHVPCFVLAGLVGAVIRQDWENGTREPLS